MTIFLGNLSAIRPIDRCASSCGSPDFVFHRKKEVRMFYQNCRNQLKTATSDFSSPETPFLGYSALIWFQDVLWFWLFSAELSTGVGATSARKAVITQTERFQAAIGAAKSRRKHFFSLRRNAG
jgi:hypothetical protein